MLTKTMLGLVLLAMILSTAACSNGNPQSNGPIKATWIEPQVAGDTVSIPVSEVENNWNVHFKVETQDDNMTFMAYIVDGEIFVRANVCPPCQSIGFSLEEAVLICDRCATTFNAETGEGISGACVDFPKASVPYEINGGNIAMKDTDLAAAYQDTLEPGWP
jgi:nitrite reductase/ring-hydroxylating ferredoxin subunit